MKGLTASARQRLSQRRQPLAAPGSDINKPITVDIAHAMNVVLADVAALYQKTKNCYWYMRGPHARDYLRLLEEQADEIYAMADQLAECIRKMDGRMLPAIGLFVGMRKVPDEDARAHSESSAVLAELCEDNRALSARLRHVLKMCEWHRDIATAGWIEIWIDKAQRRKLSLDDAC